MCTLFSTQNRPHPPHLFPHSTPPHIHRFYPSGVLYHTYLMAQEPILATLQLLAHPIIETLLSKISHLINMAHPKILIYPPPYQPHYTIYNKPLIATPYILRTSTPHWLIFTHTRITLARLHVCPLNLHKLPLAPPMRNHLRHSWQHILNSWTFVNIILH